jgi:hypothetical protein
MQSGVGLGGGRSTRKAEVRMMPRSFCIGISGTAYDNGQAYPFTYGSKVDETLKFDFADVSVTDNGVSVIAIQIDPVIAFKVDGSGDVVDPRDASNSGEIDKEIKKALKAIRRLAVRPDEIPCSSSSVARWAFFHRYCAGSQQSHATVNLTPVSSL